MLGAGVTEGEDVGEDREGEILDTDGGVTVLPLPDELEALGDLDKVQGRHLDGLVRVVTITRRALIRITRMKSLDRGLSLSVSQHGVRYSVFTVTRCLADPGLRPRISQFRPQAQAAQAGPPSLGAQRTAGTGSSRCPAWTSDPVHTLFAAPEKLHS